MKNQMAITQGIVTLFMDRYIRMLNDLKQANPNKTFHWNFNEFYTYYKDEIDSIFANGGSETGAIYD